jgi:2,3-bisphosphoglycerate-dependent phosphoglycerate mutase
MTELYYVRHSQVDYIQNDNERQLSPQGKKDVKLVTEYFKDIKVDRIVSSPYIRAVSTIQETANRSNIEIELFNELRERKVATRYIDDFEGFARNQWSNFDFKFEGGESFNEVIKRSKSRIETILQESKNKVVIVGTHGTFLSIYLNSINKEFGYEDFKKLRMQDIYKVTYEDLNVKKIEHIDIW